MELGNSETFIASEVLEHIFSFLDVKSLLQCSLVCHTFLDLTKSTRISEKMKLTLNFNCESTSEEENETSESANGYQKMVELMKTDPANLLRGYKHIEVNNFRDAYLVDEVQETFKEFMMKIGSSLTSLKLVGCEMDRDLIIEIFENLQNLEELTVDSVELEVQGAAMIDDEDTDNFPSMTKLRKFHLIKSDFLFLIFIGKCENLNELAIDNPSFNRTDIVKLEDFILKQSRLQNLIMRNLRFNSSYSTSRLSNVPFQLSQLELNNVSWDIAEHASGLMNSQGNLNKLLIYSRNLTFKQFKSMMERNRQLRWLEIGEPLLVDVNSFNALMMPATLKVLRFQWTSDFYSKLLTNMHHLDTLIVHVRTAVGIPELILAMNNLKTLRKLEIDAQFLDIQELSIPTLKSFSLVLHGIEKINAMLQEFFSKHSEIDEIELNIHPVTSEQLTFLPRQVRSLTMRSLEIVSEECVEKIVASLPRLKILKIEDAFQRTPSSIAAKLRNHGIDFQILK